VKAIITFLGGDECGNVGSTTWGNETTGVVKFPLRQAVLVDSDEANGEKKKFLEHLITKARTNQFFKVEEATEDAEATAAVVIDRKPEPRLKPNPKRGAKPGAQAPAE
jgi:hypothetical protein